MLLNNLARPLFDLARDDEAIGFSELAYALAKSSGHAIVVGQSLMLRATIYRRLGKFAQSAPLVAEAENNYRQTLPQGHIAFANVASEYAFLEQARGNPAEASRYADSAVSIAENSTQPDAVPRFVMRRSNLNLIQGKLEAAETDGRRAVQLEQELAGQEANSSRLGRALFAGAQALSALGKHEEARSACASSLEHLEATLGAGHPEVRSARQLLGAVTAR
jgi:tetratricopeptide (TPR) repeat protein